MNENHVMSLNYSNEGANKQLSATKVNSQSFHHRIDYLLCDTAAVNDNLQIMVPSFTSPVSKIFSL